MGFAVQTAVWIGISIQIATNINSRNTMPSEGQDLSTERKNSS